MGGLFIISDEFEKKLHPEAWKVFHDWNADVQSRVQIDQVNDDDLKFLSVDDRIKLKRILEIPECLNKCVGIKGGDKLYDVYFGDIFWQRGVISQLKRDLINIECDIVPPLKKIYEGRVAKAKEGERKRVEEEKSKAARAEEEKRKEEEVNIPDNFASYLRRIGSIDEMVNMGIVTEKVASVAKSELGELESEHEASPLEDRIKRKGTKKAKAFQLFNEGKGPASPEVKALGMHKSTRFKYYNQYLGI